MANDTSTTEKAVNGKPPQRNALKCLPVCLPLDKDEDGSDMVSSAGECLLFENTGTATLIVEDNGVISMVNNKALESFGYAREEVLASDRTFLDFIAPTYRETAKVYHELLLSDRIDVVPHFECIIHDSNGRPREALAEVGWIAASRQAIVSLVDLTATKAAERERHRLNTIVEQSLESILMTDLRGTIIYVNAAFEALSGYGRDEMVGQTVDHPFFSEQDRLIFHKMRFSISSQDAGEHRTPNQRKDGSEVATATRIAPVCDPKGHVIHLVCTKKDIRREAELEQQLQQSLKMEAIGSLAGGIAHDFNNIVAGILGFAEMTLQVANDQGRIRRYAGNIVQACERARDLANQVLTFSRAKEGEAKPVQIQQVVEEAMVLVDASMPANIELRQSLRADGNRVTADPTRVHQVVMNLCANAAQAMAPNGGVLEVVLENGRPPEGSQLPAMDPHASYVRLVVSDSGEGIDPRILDHIFEPYFTTKAAGGGTGLGLHLVRNIVNEMGGTIQVDSTPGQGAAFTIHWPCIPAHRTAEDETETGPALPGGSEHILVVDDEAIILDVLHDMLADLGYQVETALNAHFALERLKTNANRYDLVITDLIMPGMNGRELAEAIKQIAPSVPIILCTGMAHSITPTDADRLNLKALLTKPIQQEELAELVRAVLDKGDVLYFSTFSGES